MDNYEELLKLSDELQEYTDIERTELGEACLLLTSLISYGDYISEQFSQALEREIEAQLKNFKENSRIVESEISGKRKYIDLEWIK